MAKDKNTKRNKKGNLNISKKNENFNTISSNDKEIKKQTVEKAKKNLHFQRSNETDEFSKLVKIILLVTVIMVVFYFVTTIVTRKANAIKAVRNIKTNDKAEIQYDNVIIGSMLNMEGSYYVLIENEDDSNISEYKSLVQTIAANDDAPKIYTASLSNSFNKIYLSDDNKYDSNLENFKVKGTTLVKVSNHDIEETFDTYDSIKNKLDELK